MSNRPASRARIRMASALTIAILAFLLIVPPLSLWVLLETGSSDTDLAAVGQLAGLPITKTTMMTISKSMVSSSTPGHAIRRLMPVAISPDDLKFLNHALVDEKHKLVVCAIPKVASSEWKKLFLRLQGDPNWRDEPWWKLKNLTTLYKLEQRTYPGRAMEILTDASWTKGVFFRDPLRRLLSCYKDKFMNGTERSRKYSVKVFQADHILSFEDFLERITKPGAPMNVHWRPQADICLVGQLWHLYNIHGNFEHIGEHAEVLLRRAKLWDDFGAHGWGGRGTDEVARPTTNQKKTDRKPTNPTWREDAMFGRNLAAHRSDYGHGGGTVKQHEAAYSEYYSTKATSTGKLAGKLLRRVRVTFRRDYAMFSQIGHHVASLLSQWQPNAAVPPVGSGGYYPSVDPFDARLYFPPPPEPAQETGEVARRGGANGGGAFIGDARGAHGQHGANKMEDDEVVLRIHEEQPP